MVGIAQPPYDQVIYKQYRPFTNSKKSITISPKPFTISSIAFTIHPIWITIILEPITIRAICFTMIGECFTTNLRVLQLTRCFLQLAMCFVQLTIVHLQSASQFTTMLYNQPPTMYNQEYRHLQSTSEILQVYLPESLIVNGVDICSCKTLSLQLTPQMHHTCSWLYYN